jgi:hypothetical protein
MNRAILERLRALIQASIRSLYTILKRFNKATIACPITLSGNSQLWNNMLTVQCLPIGPDYRYHVSCFERFGMAKIMKYRKAVAVLMLMLSRKRSSWSSWKLLLLQLPAEFAASSRKHKVHHILHAIHLSGIYILCGRWTKLIPADFCAPVVLELLGRRHRGNTFWVEIFIKQGFLPKKSCSLVSNP